MPLCTEKGLGAGDIVLDGDPAPPRKGAKQPPTFGPMSVVVKRSPISATAELLFLLLPKQIFYRNDVRQAYSLSCSLDAAVYGCL